MTYCFAVTDSSTLSVPAHEYSTAMLLGKYYLHFTHDGIKAYV